MDSGFEYNNNNIKIMRTNNNDNSKWQRFHQKYECRQCRETVTCIYGLFISLLWHSILSSLSIDQIIVYSVIA